MAYEDGEDLAELLTYTGVSDPFGGRFSETEEPTEHHLLPSVSAEYRWPAARVHAAWGHTRANPTSNSAALSVANRSTELGVRRRFWGDRLRVALTGSRSGTTIQLPPHPADQFGPGGRRVRTLEIGTDALEARLDAALLRRGQLRWDVGAAVVGIRSRVMPAEEGTADDVVLDTWFGGANLGHFPGEWPGSYRGLPIVEVDTAAGVARAGARTILGKTTPSLEGVLRSGLSIGVVRLDAALQVREGVNVFNEMSAWRIRAVDHVPPTNSRERLIRNGPYVLPDGTAATGFRIDPFLENGSFVRLRHVALTWTLPDRLAGLPLPAGDLTLAGRDLWTLSRYSGPDPEVPGVAPPHPRVFVSRLTFSF